jgi:hypothetical protein
VHGSFLQSPQLGGVHGNHMHSAWLGGYALYNSEMIQVHASECIIIFYQLSFIIFDK